MSNQHGNYLVLLHGRPLAAHDVGTVLIRLMVGAVFFTEGLQKFLLPDVRGGERDAVLTRRERGTLAPS